jgi:hypothetical protein
MSTVTKFKFSSLLGKDQRFKRMREAVLRIRIQCFLAPGSKIWNGKNPCPVYGICNAHSGSYFQELSNNYLGGKCLNSLFPIRDPQHRREGYVGLFAVV